MKLKQLQKVACVSDNQRVKVNDGRNYRTIETDCGWAFNLDYDYLGFNYEEVDRILNMTVDSFEFSQDLLTVWVS